MTKEITEKDVFSFMLDAAEKKAELDLADDTTLDDYYNCYNQLAEAKDIISNLLRVTYGEGWNYSLDWKVKAEQFLHNC